MGTHHSSATLLHCLYWWCWQMEETCTSPPLVVAAAASSQQPPPPPRVIAPATFHATVPCSKMWTCDCAAHVNIADVDVVQDVKAIFAKFIQAHLPPHLSIRGTLQTIPSSRSQQSSDVTPRFHPHRAYDAAHVQPSNQKRQRLRSSFLEEGVDGHVLDAVPYQRASSSFSSSGASSH